MNRHLLGERGNQIIQQKEDKVIVQDPTVSQKIEIKDIGDLVEYYDTLKEAKTSAKKRKKKILPILEKLWSPFREKTF